MRTVAYTPDLMFGSKLIAVLQQLALAPHAVSSLQQLAEQVAATPAPELIVMDLASQPLEQQLQPEANAVDSYLQAREGLTVAAPLLVAVYAHVDTDVRDRAKAANFDLVIPRSRFIREGQLLLQQLTA